MSELNWQRTPIITLIFFIAKGIKSLVKNITNLAPALVVIFVTDIAWIPYAIAAALLLFIIAGAILNYMHFKFALAEDAIHLRTGILNKKNITLKHERIQQAELHETWYFRPFSLTTLAVDSAGSAGKEIEIPGLEKGLALSLRQQLLANYSAPRTNSAETAETESTSTAEYQRQFSLGEIVRAGIMDNKLFVALALIIYPMSQVDVFEEHILPWMENNLLFLDNAMWMSIAFLGSILVLLFLGSLAFTVLRYYDLTLNIANQRFQARGGALSIQTLSFHYHKMQRIRVKQNLRARLLKRFTLSVSQLQPRVTQAANKAQTFLLPVLTRETLHELRHWLQLPDLSQVTWQRLGPLALLGPSIWLAILFPIAAIALYFKVGLVYGMLITTVVWVLLQLYVIARWRRYQYHVSHGWVAVKRGVFGTTENWYPLYKMQQIDVYQSPWLRLLGFGDVIMHGAAGTETIKYVPLEQAMVMQQQWTLEIAASKRHWM